MEVGGPQFDRAAQERIDRLDGGPALDRRGVDDVLAPLDVCRAERVELAVVPHRCVGIALRDARGDVGALRDDDLDGSVEEEPQLVREEHVGRVCDRDADHVLVGVQREDLKALRGRGVHQPCERPVDLARVDRDVAEAELLAQRERDVLLRDESQLEQVLAEPDALLRGLGDGVGEDGALEGPAPHEDLAELLPQARAELLDERGHR